MKKLILVTALAAVFAGGAMADDAAVVNGKVSFIGKVVEQSCSIKTTSKEQTIILRTVQRSAFAHAGDTAMATPFSISLEKCGAKTADIAKVRLYFSSPNVDSATGTLNNIEPLTTRAKNVNIQLFDNNGAENTATAMELGKAVDHTNPTGKIINDNSNPIDLGAAETAPVFKYLAKYYATKDFADITVGNVATNVDFTIAYE